MRVLKNKEGQIYTKYQKGDIVWYKLSFDSPMMQGIIVNTVGTKILCLRHIRNDKGRFVRPLPPEANGLPGTVKIHKLFLRDNYINDRVFPLLKR